MAKIDAESEAYALDYENTFINQYKIIDLEYPKFHEYITTQLKSGSDEAHLNILKAYDNTDNFDKFKNSSEFAYMYLISQIFKSEYTAGYKHTILDLSDNIQDFILLIEQCKFILWRIEFVSDDDSKNFLMHFIKTYNISPYFLMKIISTSTFTRSHLVELATLFSDNFMFTFTFHILSFMNELNPGSEKILCSLATLAVSTGNKSQACAYISQISNPGELTERTRNRYGL